MTQTVLELVQEFCGKKTLPVPNAVVGNTEVSVVQIRYLLQEALREEGEDPNWQVMKVRGTWVSTATDSQGALTTLFPGYESLVPATMWDNTLNRPILGPLGDQSWQIFKALVGSGPLNQYKIMGDELYITPQMPAGNNISVMYSTNYPVLLLGVTPALTFTSDSDTFRIPDSVIQRSLDFRWKRSKGEPWENDYNDYMGIKMGSVNKDANQPTLSLDSYTKPQVVPGIWVPAGSWNV